MPPTKSGAEEQPKTKKTTRRRSTTKKTATKKTATEPASASPAPAKKTAKTTKKRAASKPTVTKSTKKKAVKKTPKKATKKAVAKREPAAFAALGLSDEVLSALRKCEFVEPSDIQRELIPVALEGKDCLGQARTGTGKTASFALPLIERVTPGVALQALVLVPTRELASQVDNAVKQFSADHPVHTAVLYGGKKIQAQVKSLEANPEIIIATPGRVLDLNRRGILSFDAIDMVVLDEVDRMLDIGFRDDIRRILRRIEKKHQTIFVSATMDEEIRKLAKAHMTDPVEINVSGDTLTVDHIEHGFVTLHKHDKMASLIGFLKSEVPSLAIVFTNTKHAARKVAANLKKQHVVCQEIHGDLHQSKRERVMKKFRDSAIQVLVATDLASRGLDVLEVSHIVNYDIPEDTAVYVHRIGRTARMGNRGYAVTFVTPEEGTQLTSIEMLLNQQLPQFEAPWAVRTELPQEEKPQEKEEEKSDEPGRLHTPMARHEGLESLGIRPVRRTLGSRFRAPRGGRR